MNVQLIFSPTGGTRAVADALGPADSVVDLCDRNVDFSSVTLTAKDTALIAVPSYGGRVPATAAARLALPGHRPYKPLGVRSMVPRTSKRCIDCGACAAACPVGAIDGADPRVTDADACIGCMRCVGLCPVQARTIDPAALAALTERLATLCAGRKKNELFL